MLYESTNQLGYPTITSLNGREYLQRQPYETPAPGADAILLDLADGSTSVLHDAPYGANCSGDPISCTVTKTGGKTTLLTGVTLDAATGVWSATSSQDLPADYPIILGTSLDKELILYGSGKPELQSFNRSTEQQKPFLALDGRWPTKVLSLPSGPTLTANTNSTQTGATISSAPLVAGAAWTTILTLPGAFKSFGVAVPAVDEWFVVADLMPSATPHVWRVSPTSTQDVGASDDPLLPEVALRHGLGEAVLDGTRGKGLVCDGATCQSGQVDLATLARAPIGSVTLPGAARTGVTQQRWLACDAVDAIIQEAIVSDDPEANPVGYRLYSVRVLSDAKP